MCLKKTKFEPALNRLISQGDALFMAMQLDCYGKEFEKRIAAVFTNDKEKTKAYIAKLPNFKNDYQSWYSESKAVVRQIIPDRETDFISYYEQQKPRKEITFQNYMIRDGDYPLDTSKMI